MIRVMLLLVAVLNTAPAAIAEDAVIAYSPPSGLLIVARGDAARIDVFNLQSKAPLWSADGPASPRDIAIDTADPRAAVLDPLRNEVALVSLGRRSVRIVRVAETPIAARFAGGSLFVLSRDGRRLQKIDEDGSITVSVGTSPDPAFLEVSGNRLYVYSRASGSVVEYEIPTLRQLRTATADRFASAFVVDDRTGYLVYPRSGRMQTISLAGMNSDEPMSVAAVPTDLAPAMPGGVLTPGTLVIADPASKRLWHIERAESAVSAFSRGFLRGFLGLGIARAPGRESPPGIDRVWPVGSSEIAYDSASRTLYRISRDGAVVLAADAGPRSFAVAAGRLVLWKNGQVLFVGL
ncbi:MAG TPA: hypothetical protein VMT00_07155 [Thermoanaerobaculia bacterium]|nr:hypothetical protein [Thermoanaerobaculia bacterium]